MYKAVHERSSVSIFKSPGGYVIRIKNNPIVIEIINASRKWNVWRYKNINNIKIINKYKNKIVCKYIL